MVAASLRKEVSSISPPSKRIFQHGSSSMDLHAPHFHEAVREAAAGDGGEGSGSHSPSSRCDRRNIHWVEFSGDNSMVEGHIGVGGSDINVLPNCQAGRDGHAHVEDQGFLLNKFNCPDMYVGRLARLKNDMIGIHLPSMIFKYQDELYFTESSRWCRVAACRGTACDLRCRGVKHGDPGAALVPSLNPLLLLEI